MNRMGQLLDGCVFEKKTVFYFLLLSFSSSSCDPNHLSDWINRPYFNKSSWSLPHKLQTKLISFIKYIIQM